MQILTDFRLSEILYYKIGGAAKNLLKIQNSDDLREALSFIQEKKIERVMAIGIGANLLMSDDGFDGAVLWFAEPQKKQIVEIGNGFVKVFASQLLDDVIRFSFKNNLAGLGWAGGLPSTVGAAIRGNVGCFGSQIQDFFHSAEVFEVTPEGVTAKELTKDEMDFGYRTSVIKQNRSLIVGSVVFSLKKVSEEEMQKEKEVYEENIAYRKTHHPLEYPSCGSVFKNITGENVRRIIAVWPDIEGIVAEKWHGKVAMGYITKRLGLSGHRIGNAQISEKHANYISNLGNATFEDVYSLIEEIKTRFFTTFGFYPEPEVEIVR